MPPGMIGLGCEYKRKQCVNVSKHTLAFKRVQRSIPGPTPSSPRCEGRGNHRGNHGPSM